MVSLCLVHTIPGKWDSFPADDEEDKEIETEEQSHPEEIELQDETALTHEAPGNSPPRKRQRASQTVQDPDLDGSMYSSQDIACFEPTGNQIFIGNNAHHSFSKIQSPVLLLFCSEFLDRQCVYSSCSPFLGL